MKMVKNIGIILMLIIISGCTKTEKYCEEGFTLEDDICVYEENILAQRKTVY